MKESYKELGNQQGANTHLGKTCFSHRHLVDDRLLGVQEAEEDFLLRHLDLRLLHHRADGLEFYPATESADW